MQFTIEIVADSDYVLIRSGKCTWGGPHVEFYEPILSEDDMRRLRDGERVSLAQFRLADIRMV